MMSRVRSLALAAGAMAGAALAIALPGSPAGASCLPPTPLPGAIAQSPIVFVGTVRATSNANRTARVSVQAVWKGPSLPEIVEVEGSPVRGSNVLTTVDRRFEPGQRYLFIPRRHGVVFDAYCSATAVYDASVASLRPGFASPPAGPRAVVHAGSNGPQVWKWVLGATGLTLGIGLAARLARTYRRRLARP